MSPPKGKKTVDTSIKDFTTKAPTTSTFKDDWLSSNMKKVVSATSVEDIKLVCCELLSKLSELTTKISVEQNNRERLEKENKSIREDFMRFSVHYDEDVKLVKDDILAVASTSASSSSVESMKDKMDDLEGRSRRNNLRFSGIHEGSEFGYDHYSMEEFLISIIRQDIGVNLPPGAIQRAHRVGPKKPNAPRQIIACFVNHLDKENVRKTAIKKKPHFYETRIYVNEDFTASVMKKRRVLLQEQKIKRQNGNKAWVQHDELRYVENGFVYGVKMTDDVELGRPRLMFKARPERPQPEKQSYANALKQVKPMVTPAPAAKGNNPRKQRTPPSPPPPPDSKRKTHTSSLDESQHSMDSASVDEEET